MASTPRLRRRIATLAALVALVAAITSCSDDDDTTTTVANATTMPTVTPSDSWYLEGIPSADADVAQAPATTVAVAPRPSVTVTVAPNPTVTVTAKPRPTVTVTAKPRPTVTVTVHPKPKPRPTVVVTVPPVTHTVHRLSKALLDAACRWEYGNSAAYASLNPTSTERPSYWWKCFAGGNILGSGDIDLTAYCQHVWPGTRSVNPHRNSPSSASPWNYWGCA